jgi:hypothetical protein
MSTLLARPGFLVWIDEDELVIEAQTSLGEMAVPVPTIDLNALGVRAATHDRARYVIPSGLTVAAPHWIELVFGHDRPWLLGPLTAHDAATIALAFDRWRTTHPLDAS